MIFKLKILTLMLDPRWSLTAIDSNFYAGSSDSYIKPVPRLTIRTIQHKSTAYKFRRVSK